jgi:4-amino-4-deoxy-L-arabinose transferase-like glycosyltransferase
MTPVALAAIVLLGVAAGLRIMLLVRSNWLLEGDDALSALMAVRVLDGDRPLMLKNQTYAAAWEPYAMAVSYALLGISRVAAKLPALLGSIGLVGTSWLLGREVGGRAAGWFAALLAAVPPVYVLVLSLKPWAPYTEVIVLGSLSLLCALRLGWPRSGQHDRRWALGCGVAGGLALWMHPLAVWYLAAAALVMVVRVRRARLLAAIVWGVLGFTLGGLPIWLFNLQTGGATLRFILNGSQGQTADRGAVLQAWWSNDLPRGAGLWHPWGSSPPLAGIVLAIWLAAVVAWAIVGRTESRLRPLDAVVAFLLLVPLIFVLSGFGGPALNPYGFDATGRYTPPIWFALAVIGGAALAAIWQQWRWLAIGLAAVPLAINAAGIASIDPLAAFQSPYWDRLPADNGPLLAALRDEHVEAVVMNHWAGQPTMFDAAAVGQPLYAYDWYDVQAGGIDRFPEYLPKVEQADRSAYVLVTDEGEPALERKLRSMGVSFVERRVMAYVVVIPSSRKVLPAEVTDALDYRY